MNDLATFIRMALKLDDSLGWYIASAGPEQTSPYRANKKGLFFTKPHDLVGVDLRTAKFADLAFARPMAFVFDSKAAKEHLPSLLSSHCIECKSENISVHTKEPSFQVLCHGCKGMFDLAVFVEQQGYPLAGRWCARLVGRWAKDTYKMLLETPPLALSSNGAQASKAASNLAGELALEGFCALSTKGNSALDFLGDQPQMTDLTLVNVGLSDNSFSCVENFPRLTHLDIRANREFGSQVCQEIAKLTTLESLNISQTGIDNDGLAAIAALPNLKWLCVEGAKTLTDVGFHALRDHPALEVLRLGWTHITNTSIPHLLTLPNLTEVTLFDTEVTIAPDERFVGVRQT